MDTTLSVSCNGNRMLKLITEQKVDNSQLSILDEIFCIHLCSNRVYSTEDRIEVFKIMNVLKLLHRFLIDRYMTHKYVKHLMDKIKTSISDPNSRLVHELNMTIILIIDFSLVRSAKKWPITQMYYTIHVFQTKVLSGWLVN